MEITLTLVQVKDSTVSASCPMDSQKQADDHIAFFEVRVILNTAAILNIATPSLKTN